MKRRSYITRGLYLRLYTCTHENMAFVYPGLLSVCLLNVKDPKNHSLFKLDITRHFVIPRSPLLVRHGSHFVTLSTSKMMLDRLYQDVVIV
jgi:hypothetical protein